MVPSLKNFNGIMHKPRTDLRSILEKIEASCSDGNNVFNNEDN